MCLFPNETVVDHSSVIDSDRWVYFSEGYALGQKPPEKVQAKSNHPLPSIGLSHLPVRKRFELHSRFSIDLYGEIEPNLGRRVKFGGLLMRGIRRRVSSPFLLFVMYTRRRRIPSVSKRTHDIPTMKDPRLPVFALTLMSM